MKKPFLATLAVLLLGPALAQAQPTCTTLVVTGHPSYEPVAWAEGGEITGAALALVRKIAARLGVDQVVSKDFGSWEGAQGAARRGEADIIFGIYKNDERMQWLDYVEPAFMSDPVSVAVRRGEGFAYARWDDLKGRRGVMNAGESFGNEFDRFIVSSLSVASAQGVDKAFGTLLDGGADYLIIGLYPGAIEARKLGIAEQVTFLPQNIDSFGMYVGFSKRSQCNALKVRFAEQLREEVEAGRVQPLLDEARRGGGW